MTLENSWVERIHTRLLARYGSAWISMWADIDMAAVRDDWACELGRMPADAIRHALENLPERPPNAMQFKKMCISRPSYELPELPVIKASQAVVDRAMQALRPNAADPKAWAWRLRKREQEDDRLTSAQRTIWRAALDADAQDAPTVAIGGNFTPVPADCLPPGMRGAA